MSELILSVIIPTYNSAAFLEECLKSVEHEAQDGVEFILMDGASTDDTMSIVERFRHLFSHIVSEPDSGQSDAFNKGFTLAKGRFLTWLNSDDVICAGAMTAVLSILEDSSKEWLVANSVYLDEAGCVTRCCRSGGFEHFAVKRGLLNVFGPSTFFSKKLFEELGGIDESYHFCMDTEYWWRIVASGRTYQRINCYFWGLRLHSAAKTANVLLTGEYPDGMRDEVTKIQRKYYPDITPKEKQHAVTLARLWRVLNFSYIFALIETTLRRGKSIS